MTDNTSHDGIKTFRTKTGFCHVLPDKIVLTRDGMIGSIASVTVGNTISRTLLIQGMLALGLFYAAYESYVHRTTTNAYRPFLFSALALYLVYGMVRSFKNSATPVIKRECIQEVRFTHAVRGFIRAHFEVFFEDEKGRIKKRFILLPGSLSDSKQEETERAIQIMKEEGFLNG